MPASHKSCPAQRRASALVWALLLLVLGFARIAHAAPTLIPVATLTAPIYVAHTGDARLFIVQQGGQIRIVENGTLLSMPFLDVASKISTGGERGLLSVAFHPDYASNGFFYVDYTNAAGNTVVERYRVSANRNLADASSGVTLLTINQPFANHNGGQLQIGPNDGYLYIGMGDGGSGGDPMCLAQNKSSLLGKLLRLDVRANLNSAPFYGIPPSNPFLAPGDGVPDEIYALGLRNPWRFSFDRASGDLYIGDVGQGLYEEVDVKRASAGGGQNYGWPSTEGLHCYTGAGCASKPPCNDPSFVAPVFESSHSAGDCSITGGYVYRGTRASSLRGAYVFGDYCSTSLRQLREVTPGSWQATPLLTLPEAGLTSFGEDLSGELYLTLNNAVYKLGSDTPAVPAVSGRARWLGGLALAAVLARLARAKRREAC